MHSSFYPSSSVKLSNNGLGTCLLSLAHSEQERAYNEKPGLVRQHAWIYEQHTPVAGRPGGRDSRFSLCLMRDQESIDNMLAMSERMHTWTCGTIHNIMIVGSNSPTINDLRLQDIVRVGIHSFLWSLRFSTGDLRFLYEEEKRMDKTATFLSFWRLDYGQ